MSRPTLPSFDQPCSRQLDVVDQLPASTPSPPFDVRARWHRLDSRRYFNARRLAHLDDDDIAASSSPSFYVDDVVGCGASNAVYVVDQLNALPTTIRLDVIRIVFAVLDAIVVVRRLTTSRTVFVDRISRHHQRCRRRHRGGDSADEEAATTATTMPVNGSFRLRVTSPPILNGSAVQGVRHHKANGVGGGHRQTLHNVDCERDESTTLPMAWNSSTSAMADDPAAITAVNGKSAVGSVGVATTPASWSKRWPTFSSMFSVCSTTTMTTATTAVVTLRRLSNDADDESSDVIRSTAATAASETYRVRRCRHRCCCCRRQRQGRDQRRADGAATPLRTRLYLCVAVLVEIYLVGRSVDCGLSGLLRHRTPASAGLGLVTRMASSVDRVSLIDVSRNGNVGITSSTLPTIDDRWLAIIKRS